MLNKKCLMVGLVLLASSSFSAALADEPAVKLDCSGKKRDLMSLKLTIDSVSIKEQNDGLMKGIFASATDDGVTGTGRAESLEADRDYKPRKYKEYSRFVLTGLTDDKSHHAFAPVDYCTISVMVPNNIGHTRARTVRLPVQAYCDQRGGVLRVTCSVEQI